MGLQQLMIVANKIYENEKSSESLQKYLQATYETKKEHSILGYFHFLATNETDENIRLKCATYANNVESTWKNKESVEKIISLQDRYFSMCSIGWVIEKWGEKHVIGNTKVQKIAFLTNFKEHKKSRHDLGFGEPFLSYHYGPWSLSLQQDIELLKATGFLNIDKNKQGLETTSRGKSLASLFEDFMDTIPSGNLFIENLSSSSEMISKFRSTEAMLEYFYGKFPVFYEIRDKCISVSSRINGKIRIADIVLESAKEGIWHE